MLIYVSDNYDNNNNILYIRENLSELFWKNDAIKLVADRHRVGLYIQIDDKYTNASFDELFDKITDVICISYKNAYFENKIKPQGLSAEQTQLLIASLISADYDDDKKYIKTKLKTNNFYAIDGFFNFRLKNLHIKWEEITRYIPPVFSESQLKDFIIYLINEKQGKKVFIKDGKVYDKNYNRLKKINLLPKCNQLKIIKEVLLYGAGEVLLKGDLPKNDEFYLKQYFGDKIYFKVL